MNNNLQYFREQKNLSRKDVAKVLNVTPKTVWLYEKGLRGVSIDKALILAKLFNTTVEKLFGEVG